MTLAPETADFALDEMPGQELHNLLHAFRERGPIQPAHFLGLPCHIITGDAATTSPAASLPGARLPPAGGGGSILRCLQAARTFRIRE